MTAIGLNNADKTFNIHFSNDTNTDATTKLSFVLKKKIKPVLR